VVQSIKEIKEIAEERAFRKIGGPLTKSSSLDDGDEVCKWCERPLTAHTYDFFGKKRTFGYENCSCEGFLEAKKEYDERLSTIFEEEYGYMYKQHISLLIERSMIPKRWENRTFEHFEVNDKNRQAFEISKLYAESFSKSTTDGVLLTGTVGTGKTHLSAAIALYLLEREYKVMFGTVTTLLSKIRNTFGNNRESEQEVFDSMIRCQLLVVDDIGKEKATEWVEQTLYEIINTRYENNKPLIITTNFGLGDLKDRYPNVGEALIDRILEMCKGVKMTGDSWRKKHLM